MKIILTISCIKSKSNGLGGHYFSLLETANQLAKSHEVIVVNIGDQLAKALRNNPHKTHEVGYKGLTLSRTTKQLDRIIKVEQPDVIHAFDSLAFYWVRRLGIKNRIPFCITKCGGTNPIYFPYSDNIILYSKENYSFFEKTKKFAESRLSLVPNRIFDFQSDERRIRAVLDQLGEFQESFRFLRIGRIGSYYYSSAVQLMELVRRLTEEGIKCCAIFVGTVEDEEYFDKLRLGAQKNIFFFTDEQYTRNAKELIDAADAVLGTGRSFMEASSKGKLLLCPIRNSAIPIMVRNTNFDEVFHFNFSERIEVSDYNEETNYAYIKQVINEPGEAGKLRNFSIGMYREFFDAGKILEKHEDIYGSIKPPRKRYVDFFLHTLFLIRNYYR